MTEGVDIMLTRLRNYLDTRNKIIEKAKEAGYHEGYEAAKAEILKNGDNQESIDIQKNTDNGKPNSGSTPTE